MKLVAIIVLLVATVTSGSATPIAPTKPVDLAGVVVSFVWIDRTHFRADGERLRLKSGESPSHYIVILRTASSDAKTREGLTSMIRISGAMGLSHMITRLELEDGEMFVQFDSPEIPKLKAGTKIELRGYSLAGDEWGVSETLSGLEVDGIDQPTKTAEQGADGDAEEAP